MVDLVFVLKQALYRRLHFREICLAGHLLDLFVVKGRVLNRFSKDVGFLDDLLPQQFYEYLIVSYLSLK